MFANPLGRVKARGPLSLLLLLGSAITLSSVLLSYPDSDVQRSVVPTTRLAIVGACDNRQNFPLNILVFFFSFLSANMHLLPFLLVFVVRN